LGKSEEDIFSPTLPSTMTTAITNHTSSPMQHSRIKPLAILLEDLVVSCTTNLNTSKTPLPSLGLQTTTLVLTWKHFFFPRPRQMQQTIFQSTGLGG
jgi:hypothetical protein